MANQRAPEQSLINFQAKHSYIAEVDKNLAACGYSERSQFIRDTMREKIERTINVKIPPEMTLAPGRTKLRSTPSSKVDCAAGAAGEEAAAEVRKRKLK